MESFSIGKYIKMFNNLLDSKANHDFRRWDLTSSQFSIISYLMDHKDEKTMQRDLEQTFRLKNPTVTGILNLLEDKGLIQRIQNPTDRRSNFIVLTEKSLKLESEIQNAKDTADLFLLKDFSPEQIQQIETHFKLILKNVLEFVEK